MAQQPWIFLSNTFEVQTEGSNVKMLSLATDTHAKLNNETADPDINAIFTAFDPFYNAYRQICINYDIASGKYEGKTLAFETIMDTIPTEIRKWEAGVRYVYVEDSPEERELFPDKRTPFFHGTYEERISAVGSLAVQLSSDPLLASVHLVVQTFYNTALSARFAQQGNEGDIEKLSDLRENQRIITAVEMYGVLAQLMHKFRYDRAQIERFFDLSLLRVSGGSAEPAPPPPPVATETIILATKQNPPVPFSMEFMGATGEDMDVDYGDGTIETITMDGTFVPISHTYADIGNYVIRITAAKSAFLEMQALNGQHTSINLPEDINLRGLTLNDNQFGSLFIPTTFTNIIALSAANNNIDQQSINLILVTIESFGTSNGVIYLDGGNNQAPTGQGIVAKNALITRGWTVNTN